jgi:sRNA-binding protein
MSEASHNARLKHLQATLRARFPAAFPEDPRALRPLKIGIRDDLLAALGGEADERILHRLLDRHTRRIAYLRALTHTPHRIDLKDQPVDEHCRTLAAQKLEAIEVRRLARETPQTTPPAEPPSKASAPAPSSADFKAPAPSSRPARKTLRLSDRPERRSGAHFVPVRIKKRKRHSGP